jgi:hypothetical protein
MKMEAGGFPPALEGLTGYVLLRILKLYVEAQ